MRRRAVEPTGAGATGVARAGVPAASGGLAAVPNVSSPNPAKWALFSHR